MFNTWRDSCYKVDYLGEKESGEVAIVIYSS
jgi:hypothetical protein